MHNAKKTTQIATAYQPLHERVKNNQKYNMKKFITATLILSVFCFAECKKNKLDSNGLPAATQEGKNIIGFLLNGQPWKPQGSSITGNLSIDFDPNFNQGVFNIVAYDFKSSTQEQFSIGMRDSLNFAKIPTTYNLSQNSLYGISFKRSCDYFNQLNDVQSSGSLTITKLDKVNRIFAGTFNATLSKTGCPPITISEGRFDMKY